MITVTIIVAAFAAGVMTGVLILLRIGMAREQADKPFTAVPPTRSAAAARRLAGLHAQSAPDATPTSISVSDFYAQPRRPIR